MKLNVKVFCQLLKKYSYVNLRVLRESIRKIFWVNFADRNQIFICCDKNKSLWHLFDWNWYFLIKFECQSKVFISLLIVRWMDSKRSFVIGIGD